MVSTTKATIEGVQQYTARGYADAMGLMASAGYRQSDPERFHGYGDLLIATIKAGGTRPFHYHKEGRDTVGCVAGKVTLVLYDMREGSPTQGQLDQIELGFDGTEIDFVQIPPLVAHAIRGIAADSVMVDLASSEAQDSSDFFIADPASVPYTF
jgi:dTDP-4-dehydrorhamnose 3,5-epimerase